ncbi:ras-related protein Rab-8A-like [Gigantopelta aegis]|uniref:ras-related protein Rab-8A-like n=1 Tax=Gigantopelta aegis TaxID=1735272 RepID=UPI001B88BF07|nr:ras-related protein Rab-8A-like [Gigantopelta aegis]
MNNFTGCDSDSTFARRGKINALNFIMADPLIQSSFQQLGVEWNLKAAWGDFDDISNSGTLFVFLFAGVDFVKKIFEVDGTLIELVIWDTAGQERFRSITRLQYRGVQGIVLVYDVTNMASFHHLSYWITSIQREISHSHGNKHSYEPIPIVLCGNKCDVTDKRQVKTTKGEKLAQREMAFEFYETSAKSGENVFQAFQKLAFHVTDICDPKLMRSYHPYMIRHSDATTPPETRDPPPTHRWPTKDLFKCRNRKHKSTEHGRLLCGCFR